MSSEIKESETYPTAAIKAVESLITFLDNRGIRTSKRQLAYLALLKEDQLSPAEMGIAIKTSKQAGGDAIEALRYPARLAERKKVGGANMGKLSDDGRSWGLKFGLIQKGAKS